MHGLRHISAGHWGLVLLPFKAYILLAYVAARICALGAPRVRHGDTPLFIPDVVILGYGICFIVMAIAAVAQLVLRKQSAAAASGFYALLSVILGWYLLPPFATA